MVNNEKMDIMNDREFTSLYQKFKKRYDQLGLILIFNIF